MAFDCLFHKLDSIKVVQHHLDGAASRFLVFPRTISVAVHSPAEGTPFVLVFLGVVLACSRIAWPLVFLDLVRGALRSFPTSHGLRLALLHGPEDGHFGRFGFLVVIVLFHCVFSSWYCCFRTFRALHNLH